MSACVIHGEAASLTISTWPQSTNGSSRKWRESLEPVNRDDDKMSSTTERQGCGEGKTTERIVFKWYRAVQTRLSAGPSKVFSDLLVVPQHTNRLLKDGQGLDIAAAQTLCKRP